jgi:hypothetical protein
MARLFARTPEAVANTVRLAERLGVKIGDRISVGESSLVVTAIVRQEPEVAGIVFALGPKLLLNLDDVPGIVHVAKEPSDKNAIAVIDRTIQTIKKDIASDIIDEGGRWDQKVGGVTTAFNSRPHSQTVVSPNAVATNEVAQFKLLQKNASNFVVNRSQTIAKQTQLREAGAFRVSEPNARSFNPQWSDKAFNLKSVKGDQVTNTSNKSFLLNTHTGSPKGFDRATGTAL